MFEKRQDDICCWAVAEAGRIGPAAGPATVTQSALSRLPGASSAVCTSRHRTTQGSRVSTTASQRYAPPATGPAAGPATVTPSAPSQSPGVSSVVCTSRHRTTQDSRVSTTASQRYAPPAIGPASARASAPVATGDFSSPPSPTSTRPARAGSAPPRTLGPGLDNRFRRHLIHAALHCKHARRHAPGGAGHSGTRHHAGGALCRSPGPDSAVGTAAKCVWTGRAWRLSSASSVRRTGTAMACIDTATHRHRREGCTPSRLNGDRDGSVLGATLIKRSGVEPRAVARHRRAGRVCLLRQIRGLAAVHGREGGGGSAATTGKTIPCGRKYAETIACAGFQAARTPLPRHRFARDNGIYRE